MVRASADKCGFRRTRITENLAQPVDIGAGLFECDDGEGLVVGHEVAGKQYGRDALGGCAPRRRVRGRARCGRAGEACERIPSAFAVKRFCTACLVTPCSRRWHSRGLAGAAGLVDEVSDQRVADVAEMLGDGHRG